MSPVDFEAPFGLARDRLRAESRKHYKAVLSNYVIVNEGF